MVGAIALSFIGQSNVVRQQLAHKLIGPNAPVAAAAASNGALQTGPVGTAGGAEQHCQGTTPAKAGNGASVYSTNCSSATARRAKASPASSRRWRATRS